MTPKSVNWAQSFPIVYYTPLPRFQTHIPEVEFIVLLKQQLSISYCNKWYHTLHIALVGILHVIFTFSKWTPSILSIEINHQYLPLLAVICLSDCYLLN